MEAAGHQLTFTLRRATSRAGARRFERFLALYRLAQCGLAAPPRDPLGRGFPTSFAARLLLRGCLDFSDPVDVAARRGFFFLATMPNPSCSPWTAMQIISSRASVC